MHTKSQIKIALQEYDRLGSVTVVVRRLVYPTMATLYTGSWKYVKAPGFRRLKVKLDVVAKHIKLQILTPSQALIR